MLLKVILEILEFVRDSKQDYRRDTPCDTYEFKFSKKPYNIPFNISVYRSPKLVESYHDIPEFLPGRIIDDVLYIVSGVTQEDPNTIEVEIYLNPKKEGELVYQQLEFALVDYINHEFRHIVQMNYNNTPNIIPEPTNTEKRNSVINDRYEYTLLPDETDALIYGWMALSQHRSVSFETVVQENLNSWLKAGEITESQRDELFKHFLIEE